MLLEVVYKRRVVQVVRADDMQLAGQRHFSRGDDARFLERRRYEMGISN